jgi:hypothetical protein
MRHAVAGCLLALALVLVGCESETRHGPCIGVFDTPDPALVYKVSARNAIVSLIGFELVFPPVIWLVADFRCPSGRVAPPAGPPAASPPTVNVQLRVMVDVDVVDTDAGVR